MRFMKMLGLAAVAAVAAMAFIGASSASAAVVCKLASPGGTGGCPAGEAPYAGSILGLGVGKDVFTSSFATVECNGEMTGSIESTGLGKIEKVTWSSCSNNIGCSTTTAVAENLNWHVEALSGGVIHFNNVQGSFTLSGGGACIFGAIKCVYGKASVLGTFTNHSGATAPKLKAEPKNLEKKAGSSGVCSNEGSWTGTYNIDPTDLSVH